jgi:hypothetical protein
VSGEVSNVMFPVPDVKVVTLSVPTVVVDDVNVPG